jgi:hypothetical protein
MFRLVQDSVGRLNTDMVRRNLGSRRYSKHVALDGFYKHPDESVTPMPNEEFYEFD